MYQMSPQSGLGLTVTIPPLESGWTPASIDVFTDMGSALHLAYGAFAGAMPFDVTLLLFALMAGYEATKAAGGESWQRIGGVWVEFAIGLGAGLVAQRLQKKGRH